MVDESEEQGETPQTPTETSNNFLREWGRRSLGVLKGVPVEDPRYLDANSNQAGVALLGTMGLIIGLAIPSPDFVIGVARLLGLGLGMGAAGAVSIGFVDTLVARHQIRSE